MKGKPKPKVKWLKEGEEIFPSEEYQIENFEDGTSVLIINDLYPDDTGTITFEAFNSLGVAITTTELIVEEGIIKISLNEFLLNYFYLLFNFLRNISDYLPFSPNISLSFYLHKNTITTFLHFIVKFI